MIRSDASVASRCDMKAPFEMFPAEDPAAVYHVLLAHANPSRPHKLHVVDGLLLRPHPCDATTVVPVSIDCLGIGDQEPLFAARSLNRVYRSIWRALLPPP